MQWIRHITGLTFIFFFVVTYFTNKVSVDVFRVLKVDSQLRARNLTLVRTL